MARKKFERARKGEIRATTRFDDIYRQKLFWVTMQSRHSGLPFSWEALMGSGGDWRYDGKQGGREGPIEQSRIKLFIRVLIHKLCVRTADLVGD